MIYPVQPDFDERRPWLDVEAAKGRHDGIAPLYATVMSFEDPNVRRAFRLGARAIYESVIFYIPLREQQVLREWMRQLEMWDAGEPPATPHPWKSMLPHFDDADHADA